MGVSICIELAQALKERVDRLWYEIQSKAENQTKSARNEVVVIGIYN